MDNRKPWASRQVSDSLCECGCGERTFLAVKTNKNLGHVEGQPLRFISGHNNRRKEEPWPEPAEPEAIRKALNYRRR